VGSSFTSGTIGASHPDEYIGRKLAERYAFTKILGAGGTGTVYLCEDLLLHRKVAVKTILPALADNLNIRRRIDRECQLHAAIGAHPYIVTLYDKIEQNDRIFLIMEYVRGKCLADILKKNNGNLNGRWRVEDALALIRQLLQAIACIHNHGILHRDIKTSNILIYRRQENQYLAKLMDFGIARMEEDGEALTRLTQLDTSGPGTPTYMAPERIDPRKFGESCPATDLYSVGIILYQLLSDGPPFRGTISEIFNGHLHQPVDLSRLNNQVSSNLRSIIIKALAKNPGDRFGDADSFAHALPGEKKSGALPITGRKAGTEATLPVIDLHDAHGVESTLLAPEPEGTDRRLPRPKKRRRSLALLAIALLGCFIFLVTLRFFIRAGNDRQPSSTIATQTDNSAQHPKKKVIPVTRPVSSENTTKIPATAMDALRDSRATALEGQNGLTIDGTFNERPSTENSDWQVLESSAQRIDKKHP